MNLQAIFIRENVIKSIREFFYAQGFHEIITPTFNYALPLEPNVYAFESEWHTIHGSQKLYLSTSPESGLKKMIAAGVESCFAIGKSFRNLEDSGSTHLPEFLMLEWYRKNATYQTIMDDAEHLIKSVLSEEKTAGNWPRFTMTDLFHAHAHLDLKEILDDNSMIQAAHKKGYSIENATWEQLFNQIFLNEIEPKLGMDPCFVIDFPSRISPLCALKKDQPYLSQRFEIYLAGMELGNGNTENTDIKTIRKVFDAEKRERKNMGKMIPTIDETFIAALEKMNDGTYSGIGLGIDRLAMIAASVQSIEEVEPLVVAHTNSSEV